MANKKITDATTATSVAGTDKVFLNQGGDLKQVDLNSAVANSQAVQTLNSNLGTCVVLGIYDTNNSNGNGSNPQASAQIQLSDDISNYRFLYVISAYYPAMTAVFGTILIPTSLFVISNELIFYSVRTSENTIVNDGIGRSNDGNNYIILQCTSTIPMVVYGIK